MPGNSAINYRRLLSPGLAAYFVKGALDRGIPLHTGVSAEELIGDGERIVGVRARRDGQDLFIKANRGVVIAVSGYEKNRDLAKTLSNVLEPISMVMGTVDGAHFRLAGPVGARIARVPDPANLGMLIPGEEHDNGSPLGRGSLPFLGLPHTIVVNRAGKRFSNEAFYRSIYYAVDAIDGATQTHPNYPCWAVFDQQARSKYPFGSAMPGEDLPDGLGVKAHTLSELAAKIGVDIEGLEQTVKTFNGYAEAGVDPDFQRGTFPWGAAMTGDLKHKPNPNLGPLRCAENQAASIKLAAFHQFQRKVGDRMTNIEPQFFIEAFKRAYDSLEGHKDKTDQGAERWLAENLPKIRRDDT